MAAGSAPSFLVCAQRLATGKMQDFVEAAVDGACNGDLFDLAAKTVDPRRAGAYPVSPELPAVEPEIEVPEIEPRIAANLPQRR